MGKRKIHDDFYEANLSYSELESLANEIRNDILNGQGAELKDAQPALMLSELEDILVAVDLRGHQFTPGLWERATHLCILDSKENLVEIQSQSSISKLVQGDEINIIQELW